MLSTTARVRIAALLQNAEAGYLSSNSRMIMRALDSSAPEDPLFQMVSHNLETMQGVRLRELRVRDFHGAANSKLDDSLFLFMVPLAAHGLEQMWNHGTYQFSTRPSVLIEQIQRVLDEEGAPVRVDATGVFPYDAVEPPDLGEKFGILRSPRQLPKDFAEWVVNGPSMGVVFLDIDGFKSFNTKYTESVVDRCLLPRFQQRVEMEVSGRGGAYAHGGDEVVLLLRNVVDAELGAFAERLRSRAASWTFDFDGKVERITVSIGATLAVPGESLTNALERANAAENRAKRAGKNRVVIA